MEKVDPELEVKIKEAKKLIAKMALDKLQFTYTLDEMIASKMYDPSSLLSWLRYLNAQKDCLRYLLIKETKKMDRLQVLLDKLRYADTDQTKSIKECLSPQEMNNHRQKLQCRMGHGSKSLRKEMQLLKDMKPSQQEDKSFWIHYTDGRLGPMEQRLLWHHQMPVSIITGDAVEDLIIEFRNCLWRIQSCGVVLGNDYESIVTHNVKGNSIVKEENWSLLDSKVALQEQIRLLVRK